MYAVYIGRGLRIFGAMPVKEHGAADQRAGQAQRTEPGADDGGLQDLPVHGQRDEEVQQGEVEDAHHRIGDGVAGEHRGL